MKKFSIIAMVLAFTMMLSVVSFAAPAFKLDEGATVPEGTTVTPAADSIDVTTPATAGNYYGILLVEGNALPTVDNAILYINQATAADVTQAFEVLPNMAELADGDKLTLYISSNVANANLIAIPMVYADEVIVPEVNVAEVDGDGDITIADAMEVVYFVNWEASMLDDMDFDTVAVPTCDIDGDGDITIADAMEIIYYVNWEASLLDSILF